MIHFSNTVLIFWAISTIGKAALIFPAWKARKSYPCFFVFSVILCAYTIALWIPALTHNGLLYWKVYYTGDILYSGALLAVIIEVGKYLFHPTKILPIRERYTYRTVLGVLTSVTCAAAYTALRSSYSSTPALRGDNLCKWFDRASLFVFLVGLIAVVCLSAYFSIPWRTRAKHIAAGMAVMFSGGILGQLVAHKNWEVAQWVVVLFGLIALAVWMIGIVQRDKVKGETLISLGPEDEKWLQELVQVTEAWD